MSAFRAQFNVLPVSYATVALSPRSHYLVTINMRIPGATLTTLAGANTAIFILFGDPATPEDGIFGTDTPPYQFESDFSGIPAGTVPSDTSFDVVADLTFVSGTSWDVVWTADGTILATDSSVDLGFADTDPMPLYIGAPIIISSLAQTYYFNSVHVTGLTTGDEVFFDDFADGDFSLWDATSGDATIVARPPEPVTSSFFSPLWRWVVTDLEGTTITILDKLASDRQVQPNLNAPLELSGTVPSDSPEVNVLHTDNFPFLAEGIRQIYGFRREHGDIVDTSCDLGGHGYYTIRASTLCLQITDEANAGDARSRFSAWDPWQYLFYRPIYVDDGASGNELIPQKGYTYPSGFTMDEIVIDILTRMSNVVDAAGPPLASQFAFTDWGWSGFYGTNCTDSVIQTCGTSSDGWHIEPGTSIGQALQDICSAGYMDIIMLPIYDPVNRPGILCEMSIYKQTSDPDSGAGSRNYAAQFAWDAPGRSTTGFTDLFDGTQRANKVQFRNGQAGPLVPVQRDATSIARYGEYWAEQSFPAQTQAVAVTAIAAEQLVLRKDFKQTLTLNPAPEFSPQPFVDYYLGDRVPVFVGHAQRGTYQLGDNSPRQALPPGYQGAPPTPDPATLVWQRIYGIPVDIDDNGTETVRELLVGPIGPPAVEEE